jgi:hypothetical protein
MCYYAQLLVLSCECLFCSVHLETYQLNFKYLQLPTNTTHAHFSPSLQRSESLKRIAPPLFPLVWHRPVIPAFLRLEQKDCKLEDGLGYIVETLSQKKKKNQKVVYRPL